MFQNLGTAGAMMIAAGAAMMLGGAAMADDLVPPSWIDKHPRGTPYTTYQTWDFDQTGNVQADEWFNEGKDGDTPRLYAGANVTWGNGGWTGGGGGGSSLTFYCPNWIDQEPAKWIWIQIHGSWPGTVAAPIPPSVYEVIGERADEDDPYPGQVLNTYDTTPGSHRVEWWQLIPNPDDEYINIALPQGAFVDQVVIDTISFPAPGAVGAFGIAGLAMVRRRR